MNQYNVFIVIKQVVQYLSLPLGVILRHFVACYLILIKNVALKKSSPPPHQTGAVTVLSNVYFIFASGKVFLATLSQRDQNITMLFAVKLPPSPFKSKTDLTNIILRDLNTTRKRIKFPKIFSMNEKVASNRLGLTY